jgi:hypothetical protein
MKLSIRLISLLALFLSLGIGMVSCLKDKDYDDGLIQSTHGSSPRMIEVKLTASSATNFLVLAVDAVDRDTTLNFIPINLSTSGPATEDLNITLVQKNSLVTDYNTVHNTSYQVPPASMFTVINTGNIVKIAKGTNTGYLQLKYNPIDYVGQDWALGYEISAVDKSGYTISGNLSTGIVAIVAKNEYDGEYDVEGYFDHPTAAREIHQEEHLATSGPKSNKKTLGDLTGTNVILTINPNNTVTVTPGPGTSGTTASVANISGDPIYNNRYDPVTKTYWLKYGYPNPGPTRIITEKVTLQ